jgi:cytochrome P450
MSEPTVAGTDFQLDLMLRPDFSRAPQPYFKRMRDNAPVARTDSMFGTGKMVLVAKHRDVEFALRNPEIFSSRLNQGVASGVAMIPQQIDPPDHLQYRRLLDPLFGPRQMNKLEEHIARRANELIDAFIERGECDYAAEYAVPLPCSVFLKLLGLPLDEVDDFVLLKDKIVRGSRDGTLSQADKVRQEGTAELLQRVERLMAERQREPKDDLITQLLHCDIDGRPLRHEELLGICFLLFIAGLDTVTDSLTCFYAFLGRNHGYRRRLAEDPDIIPAAVEEMMRYETPAPFVPRLATQPTELSGCPVQAGDHVILLLGSANTDDEAQERPQTVDYDRPFIRHLSFGGGIHRCLGSHLARNELRISLREWHRRIPDYHIPDDVELEFAPVLRQVEHLPIVFDKVVG